MKNTRVY